MPPGQSTTGARAPGSFAPLLPISAQSTSSKTSPSTPSQNRPRNESTSSEDSYSEQQPVVRRSQNAPSPRLPATQPGLTIHTNSSSNSLQNLPRPPFSQPRPGDIPSRTASPLSGTPRTNTIDFKTHSRKHSNSQGFFEPSLRDTSILSNNGMAGPAPALTASQIAAQAAMQHQSLHQRQRSMTLPIENTYGGPRRPSRGPASPPLLSLTEASGERQSGFGSMSGNGGQVYRNGLLGTGTTAAATAAAVVFQRSPQMSPILPPSEYVPGSREPEKLTKSEKSSKVKLFSRPNKITLSKDTKERSIPSPNKLGQFTLQRSNQSAYSLADSTTSSASSMYSMTNSSSATIRAMDTPLEKEKDKEKKHHFLSRQKAKLSSKDDHHLPLSSAASNSRPVDPSAPSSLYNFSLPPSPGPSTTSFAKSMSGLDLRHGGRALREKKKEEKAAAAAEPALRDGEMTYQGSSEWPGPSSLGSGGGASFLTPSTTGVGSSIYAVDTQDLAKYGLNNMTADDAWPFLKAKLLVIFEGEDLRLPVEDFNRLVSIHVQRCIQKRAPNLIVEDLRDFLTTGFSSLDQTIRRVPDDRLIPHLVEMWLFTFTSILPYMQAIFLPLDLEFSGHGPLMSPDKAREFWGALPAFSTLPTNTNPNRNSHSIVPAGQMLEVRRIVLIAYRDTIILPRFDTLKTIFSRLSLESIGSHINHATENLSSSPDSANRPATAISLDPSMSSYSSQSTTLLGAESSGARSRAISNVSYGSDRNPNLDPTSMPPPPARPFTPLSTHPWIMGAGPGSGRDLAAIQREANAEDGKHVTETVGRMLQCMSVLASVGVVAGAGNAGSEESQERMEELCRALKLNWLGRGRMGRNRRGLVGARIIKEGSGSTRL